MKKVFFPFALVLWCIVAAIAIPASLLCFTRTTPAISYAQPGVVIDTLDPSLVPVENLWRDEIVRRFPTNTVGVLCHGGAFLDNQWIVLANPGSTHCLETVDDLVRDEQTRWPGRRIVLLCCNPTHLQYHNHPNVFYASGSVWCVPDRAVQSNPTDAFSTLSHVVGFSDLIAPQPNRSVAEPLNVGNIFEFNEAE